MGAKLSLLALSCLLWACQNVASENQQASVHPIRQDFVHWVQSEGELQPVVQETLNVPERMWGTLEMLLPEGQQVKKGQVIAKVNSRHFIERMNRYMERSTEERANLMKQRAELPLERLKIQSSVQEKQRQTQIQKLEEELVKEGPRSDERVKARIEAELAALRIAHFPIAEKENLYNKGYLPEQDLKTAQQDLLALETTRETSELTLQQQTQAYRAPDIQGAGLKTRSASLETRIAELEGKSRQSLLRTQTRNQSSRVKGFDRRFSSMQERMNGAEIKAPFDGTILYPRLWGNQIPTVGMEVWNGLPIVQVVRTDQLRVLTRVDEFRIPFVKLGQRVRCTSPGLPGQVFMGKVAKIQKLAKYKDESKPTGLKYFEIEVTLDQLPKELKAHMRVQTEIEVQSLKNVWTLPLEALEEKDQKAHLKQLTAGKVENREVKILARNEDQAVLAGEFSGQEEILLGETP